MVLKNFNPVFIGGMGSQEMLGFFSVSWSDLFWLTESQSLGETVGETTDPLMSRTLWVTLSSSRCAHLYVVMGTSQEGSTPGGKVRRTPRPRRQ